MNQFGEARSKSARFFPWLAGASADVLAEVPSERGWYSKMGAALLVPFVLGTAGVTVILHVVTQAQSFNSWFLLLGVIWGALVVVVDRLIISPRYNAVDLRNPAPESKYGWISTLALGTLRVVLAVGIAFTVSEPLVALMFSSEAIDQAESEAQAEFESFTESETARINDSLDAKLALVQPQVDARRADIDQQIQTLRNEVESANSQYLAQVALCQQEQVDGNGDERGGGFGPVATRLCDPVPVLKESWELIRAENSPLVASLIADLDVITQPISDATTEAEVALASLPSGPEPVALGLWDRIERANSIVDPVWRWSLALVLVLLDSVAVLVKMLGGRRAHDGLLATKSSLALTEANDQAQRRVALLIGAESDGSGVVFDADTGQLLETPLQESPLRESPLDETREIPTSDWPSDVTKPRQVTVSAEVS